MNGGADSQVSFRRLRQLKWLHTFPFRYSIPMDENRYRDGINLRYRFGYERGVDHRLIDLYFADDPCSVLEMMVALCLRCEEQIMCNDEEGDRTCEWFNSMMDSLGMAKVVYGTEAYDILSRFVNREYEPDGKGGLFTIPNCEKDMRTAEIWYQAMWYLDEVLKKEG